MGPFLQNIVGTSADDNAVFFICQLLDRLRFCLKDFIFWRRCIWRIGIHLINQIIKETVCHFFFPVFNKFSGIAGSSGDHFNNFPIVKFISQFLSQFFPNFMSAAAVLTANSNGPVGFRFLKSFRPLFLICFRIKQSRKKRKKPSKESGNKSY